jgi:hypothetical protein
VKKLSGSKIKEIIIYDYTDGNSVGRAHLKHGQIPNCGEVSMGLGRKRE